MIFIRTENVSAWVGESRLCERMIERERQVSFLCANTLRADNMFHMSINPEFETGE